MWLQLREVWRPDQPCTETSCFEDWAVLDMSRGRKLRLHPHQASRPLLPSLYSAPPSAQESGV